ncbi:arginyl-tRNA--protein transferase 1-like [Tropilaelaps mercedesae]|uniref:Arginyl-tRNA--protein transferase 1 n=1 Tax=Tropilaelaps mercedesae TaxID=418985 RepID=A0A1V9XM48_9ACAR|nr:arginyl-tRNA--protein transferase 1-like [Tropilaelaps mercedesae]
MVGIVQYFSGDDNHGHRCGYCQGSFSNFCNGMWAYVLSPQNYQDLIDRGWRRSGKYCYKPSMKKTCCPQYTIRCNALSFKPSKSQKKVLKRVHRFLLNGRKELDEEGPIAVRDPGNSRVFSGESNTGDYGDCRGIDEPDMSGRGAGRINDKIRPDAEISDNRITEEPSFINHFQQNLPASSIQSKMDDTSATIASVKQGPSLKKKEWRKRKWAEKRKAANLPIEVGTTHSKNREKTLDEWLTLPHGKHKLDIRLVRTAPYGSEAKASEDASHGVYTLYQRKIHNYTEEKCRKSEWKQFLVDSPLLPIRGTPLGSFHHQYWLDGRLIAVGVLDILPSCISSVYFYYDPEFSFLSLGTFSSLCEIKLARDLNQQLATLKYYYMGFYIHNCAKMRYKGRLPNSELLCPEAYTWQPIARCIPLLEANKYSRLESNENLKDVLKPSKITQTSILHDKTGMTLIQYLRQKNVEENELDEIKEYCELVGSELMEELYLLREPSE